MKVKPLLDNWEIPNIASIGALEQRGLVELPVPGRVGSLFQDTNTIPTRVVIAGSLFGDDARSDFVDKLRGRFRAGDPVTFVADIVTATEVQYVVVDALRFAESGRAPDEVEYLIVLIESPAPTAPGGGGPDGLAAAGAGALGDLDPGALADIDSGLLDQAAGFVDTATGALSVVEGLSSAPDLEDPTGRITPAVDGIAQATSGLGAALGPLHDIFGSGG